MFNQRTKTKPNKTKSRTCLRDRRATPSRLPCAAESRTANIPCHPEDKHRICENAKIKKNNKNRNKFFKKILTIRCITSTQLLPFTVTQAPLKTKEKKRKKKNRNYIVGKVIVRVVVSGVWCWCIQTRAPVPCRRALSASIPRSL
jgi:hypothetical protein